MIEYRTAKPQDMDELIDFINMVFSMLRVPHNFAVVLPKVYAAEPPVSEIHEIAREGGRLCGVVGVLPYEMRLAGERLSVGYVGSVSVHPRVRGQGVMRELMRRQIEKAKMEGLDMLALGGQRQRYEYYGFAACGSRTSYTVSRANVRHTLADVDAQGISFRALNEADAEAALTIHEKQPVTCGRTKENIVKSLKSYWNQALAVCQNGRVTGYVMASKDDRCIYELALEQEAALPAVIRAWLEQHSVPAVSIVTEPYDMARRIFLGSIGEGGSTASDEMFLCLKPDRVIAAMMKHKRAAVPMEDGVIKLGFGGFGTLRIAVSGEEVSVCRTEETPDVALDDRKAHEFVFGHDRSAWLCEDMRMPRGWFPLQLHLMEADRF